MSKTVRKKQVKLWINIVTLVALVLLVFISRDQIKEALTNLTTLNLWVLLLMIPTQLIGYYALARLYRDFFVAHGQKISLREMYKVTLELNFVNHVFPSGGVSGFSYLSLRLKPLGVPIYRSTLAQILRFALTFLSFIIILVVGMIALSLGKNTSPFVVLVSSTIIFATITGSAIGIFIISKPRRIKAFVSWLPKFLNYISRFIRRNKDIVDMRKVESTLEDLHKDYMLLSKDTGLIKRLLSWALIVNITEVLTIYFVYIAFGTWINPGALIIAYAVANFAGLIAVLPGGVGIYEGLMTAVLASAGVNKALALSATVIYRILTMAVFLPIGYYFYSKVISQTTELNIRKVNKNATSTNAK